MSNFPELAVIQIAAPCNKEWDKMSGNERQRFCDHCEKHVHNFSEMTAAEVRGLIASDNDICARIKTHPDGSMITRQTTRRRLLSRVRRIAALAAAVAIAGCSKRAVDNPPVTGIVHVPVQSTDGNTSNEQLTLESMGEVKQASDEIRETSDEPALLMGRVLRPESTED